MKYEELKCLIDDVGKSNIEDISLEFPDGLKINIKKKGDSIQGQATNFVTNLNAITNTTSTSAEISNADLTEIKDDKTKIVTSPVVGTFYTKSSPTDAPYVKVGQKVKKGDVLCIIEAMKLMNEIESEYSGEIVEVLAKDEELVDFGKPLFKIREV